MCNDDQLDFLKVALRQRNRTVHLFSSVSFSISVIITNAMVMAAILFCCWIIFFQWVQGAQREDLYVKLNLSESNLHGARWEFQPKSKPKEVYHTVEIIDISNINDAKAEFRLDINLRQRWHEADLIMPFDLFIQESDPPNANVTLDALALKDLWTPEAYMPNSRHSAIEGLVAPHSSIRIYINKTIIFEATMQATVGCAMNFQWYPCDVQFCELIFESFTHPVDHVTFKWDDVIQEPVILPKNFKLRRYSLLTPLAYSSGTCNRFGRGEYYSRIMAKFVLQRDIGHHLIQVYMPTFLIVALSWFSFWLGMDAIPGRVSLIVTCMLTLVTMYGGLKGDLPPVTYIKMLDIWMATCLGFVFSAMVEFITVRYIFHAQKKTEKRNDDPNYELNHAKKMQQLDNMNRNPYSEFYRATPSIMNELNQRRAWEVIGLEGEYRLRMSDENREYFEVRKGKRNPTKHNRLSENRHFNGGMGNRDGEQAQFQTPKWESIDKRSRVIFPIAFFFFCCVYWPYLLIGSKVWQFKTVHP